MQGMHLSTGSCPPYKAANPGQTALKLQRPRQGGSTARDPGSPRPHLGKGSAGAEARRRDPTSEREQCSASLLEKEQRELC